MSDSLRNSVRDELLAGGIDDLIYAAWVSGIARTSGIEDSDQLRQLSIGLIAELLVEGLVVAGEFDGHGHRPWDCSTGEAIVRIVEDWQLWGRVTPTPGAVVWLALTDAGRAIGQAVIDREEGRS